MILSSYERKRSPFVYVQFGESYADREYIKTAIRKTDPNKKRKVAQELNRIEAQLLPSIGQNHNHNGNGEAWRWIDSFIRTRYAARERTQQVYLAQWRRLRGFLMENKTDAPAMLTRELVFDYPAWRCGQTKEKSRRTPKLSTAIGELKLLALIMDEAINRKLAVVNPARDLKIEREETAIRPEITDEMLLIILRELEPQPEWMQKSFAVAINTGLRFSETRLHRSQIRAASDDIIIEKPKGGRKREFAIPIYDSVRELIQSFMRSRDAYLWTAPAGTLTGLQWSKFLKGSAAYVPNLCFHSTRITFITRGMRAGIPEPVMMKMVNHADKDISRIYQRWTSDDVRQFADRLPNLTAFGAPKQNHRKK